MTDKGVSADVEGEERVQQVLQAISTPGFLAGAFHEIGAQINTDLAKYPPELPEQQYIRTGELGRRWTHEEEVTLFSVSSIIGNNTPYAPDVQDPEMQAEIHAGRWLTTDLAITNRIQWIGQRILLAIKDQLQKNT